MSHAIFVYGTLKSGHSRSPMLRDQRYLGTALTTPDYNIYRYSSFPAMVKSDSGKSIFGELYEIDESCFIQLDEVEGVKYGLFFRDTVKLKSVNLFTLPISRQASVSLLEDSTATAYFFGDSNKLIGLKDCGINWTLN